MVTSEPISPEKPSKSPGNVSHVASSRIPQAALQSGIVHLSQRGVEIMRKSAMKYQNAVLHCFVAVMNSSGTLLPPKENFDNKRMVSSKAHLENNTTAGWLQQSPAQLGKSVKMEQGSPAKLSYYPLFSQINIFCFVLRASYQHIYRGR